jgi:hypothetical protein
MLIRIYASKDGRKNYRPMYQLIVYNFHWYFNAVLDNRPLKGISGANKESCIETEWQKPNIFPICERDED